MIDTNSNEQLVPLRQPLAQAFHLLRLACLGLVVLLTGLAADAQGADTKSEAKEETKTPTAWKAPTNEQIRLQLQEWLTAAAAGGNAFAQQAEPLLVDIEVGEDRLEAIVNILSLPAPRIARFVSDCRQSPPAPGPTDWLESDDVVPFVRHNLRLYAGRQLARAGYYEEALQHLAAVDLKVAADPASLLFYRAVAEHQLVRTDEARGTLLDLLGATEPLPQRMESLARLMQTDLARVEEDSLGHIARRMSDARRRLALEQAGERSQEVQLEIIASLDKLINKVEQQQQQQQQQAGRQPSGTPMEESQISDLKGEGKVDVSDIGNQSGWGDLPPKDRERVLQDIGRDFPAHYRDLIEEYLRRLATDEREQADP